MPRDSCSEISSDQSITVTLADWLAGRDWALALSAGYFGFYAHCGVISVLEEQGLRPAHLSGASAGALVAGFWAAGMPARDIATRLLELKKEDFWDPAPGPGLIRGKRFAALLREWLPVTHFEACSTPLSISVFDLLTLRTRSLNQGALEPAIRASCAVPGMFHPVWPQRRPSLDGGVADRAALKGIPENLFVLSHYLIPHERHPGSLSDLPSAQPQRSFIGFAGLTRCRPKRLHYGVAAYHDARRRMRRALTQPVSPQNLVCRHA